MWQEGIQKIQHYDDFLKAYKKYEGELNDDDAKKLLYRILIENIGFTTYLFTGVELLPLQEVILKCMFLRDSGIIVGGRGLSKTLSYNDLHKLISKKDGFQSITKVIPNIDFSLGERWVDIKPVQLWNGHQYQEVSKVLVQPKKKTLKIKTKRGYTLECAGTHILKTINGAGNNCNLIWKRAAELKTGDFLTIGRNSVDWRQNDELPLDECYLVGVAIGDGCLVPNGITITSMDEKILSFVEKFPSGKRILKRVGNEISKAKEIRLSSDFSTYLREKYNLGRHKSYTKEIPEIILKSKNGLRMFLKGLFDCDGYSETRSGGIGIGTVSEKLAQQIHLALLTFGIVSKLYVKKTNSTFGKSFVVECFGKDAKLFYERIGFILPHKQNKYQVLKTKKLNSNIDIIPFAKDCIISIHKDNGLYKSRLREEGKISINPDQKEVSPEYVKKYIQWASQNNVGDRRLNDLEEILNSNYYFDPIVEITESESDCIDFNIPNGEQYWCNGFINHNSFLISMFSLLYPIFYPQSKTCLISANFRSSRRILEYCEKVINSPKAKLIKKCFDEPRKGSDIFKFNLPNPCGSEVFALPLSSNGGEGLRGTRANAVLVDEGLLITKEIQEFIIRPFLTGKLNYQEQREIKRKEDELIKAGLLKESERQKFARNKYIILSSASYQFEYLYEYYQNVIKNCLEETELTEDEKISGGKSSFFAIRASYEAMPAGEESILDLTQINAAKALSGENSDYFKREYRALFTDASSSYFDIKKMNQCTVKAGETPTLQMFGDPDCEYLLSCDPSYSADRSSDYFAIGIYLLDKKERKITLVHTYSQAGGDLNEHFKYLIYLLRNFNIVWFAIDDSGLEFIHGFNASELASQSNLKLEIIKAQFDTDDPREYEGQMRDLKKEYNLVGKKIVYAQKFNAQSNSIRRMNEHLQNQIAAERVWFASSIECNDLAMNKYKLADLPFAIKDKFGKPMDKMDWISDQYAWVQETKSQCAMIEVKVTEGGTMQYNLPQKVRRNNSENKIRRDNYTTLLIACWSAKIYFDMHSLGTAKQQTWFIPKLI